MCPLQAYSTLILCCIFLGTSARPESLYFPNYHGHEYHSKDHFGGGFDLGYESDFGFGRDIDWGFGKELGGGVSGNNGFGVDLDADGGDETIFEGIIQGGSNGDATLDVDENEESSESRNIGGGSRSSQGAKKGTAIPNIEIAVTEEVDERQNLARNGDVRATFETAKESSSPNLNSGTGGVEEPDSSRAIDGGIDSGVISAVNFGVQQEEKINETGGVSTTLLIGQGNFETERNTKIDEDGAVNSEVSEIEQDVGRTTKATIDGSGDTDTDSAIVKASDLGSALSEVFTSGTGIGTV